MIILYSSVISSSFLITSTMDSPSTGLEPGRITFINKLYEWNEGEPVATEAWACVWLS